MQLCDRAIWLDGGRLRMMGEPARLSRDEYKRAMAVEGDSTGELKFGGRRVSGPIGEKAEATVARDERRSGTSGPN